MTDKWNEWYKDLKEENIGSFRYGNTQTYTLGYEFLKTCDKIEDWGCGAGGFKSLFNKDNLHKYIGIDGSITPFSNIKADLTNYISNVDGIFMRHILEHNYEWKIILENACKSFSKKMCLILFTPFSNQTNEISHNLKHGVDVPDLSFDKNELISIFKKYNIIYELITIQSETGYNVEHIFYLNKVSLNLAFYTYFYGSNNNYACCIPSLPSLKYNCYYYTNNKYMIEQLKDTKWIAIYDNKQTNDDLIESCMAGKHIKTMPQEYSELKDYDYLCYLDTKLNKVNEDFVENFIVKQFIEKNYCLLLRVHPFIKDNVWIEYDESMKQERYKINSDQYIQYIKNQINSGLSETVQKHCACGFLIRNMKHSKMIELNNTWYNHIQECGIQDQISFFFVKQLFNDYIYPFTENPFTENPFTVINTKQNLQHTHILELNNNWYNNVQECKIQDKITECPLIKSPLFNNCTVII